MPGVIMCVTKDGKVSKLEEVPFLEQSGVSKPMGIAYDDKGALYVCDN